MFHFSPIERIADRAGCASILSRGFDADVLWQKSKDFRETFPKLGSGMKPYHRGHDAGCVSHEGRVTATSLQHETKTSLGSAEEDSDAMCFPVIREHDAELAVEGDAIDLH